MEIKIEQLTILFVKLNFHLQLIFGLQGLWLETRQLKISECNAIMVIASFMNIFYALFLAIAVAGLANVITTWVFFAVDFLFNAYDLFKIFKAAKSNMADVAEDVLLSVQGMFIGFVVSLTYLVSLVVIYNGENAVVMGNIKNRDLKGDVIEEDEEEETQEDEDSDNNDEDEENKTPDDGNRSDDQSEVRNKQSYYRLLFVTDTNYSSQTPRRISH